MQAKESFEKCFKGEMTPMNNLNSQIIFTKMGESVVKLMTSSKNAATLGMTAASKAALLGAMAGLVLVLDNENVFATEPGNFTNQIAGATVGAPIAAAPPPGLFFNNSFVYLPMGTGNGNFNANVACAACSPQRYNGIADAVTLTWSTGLTFLGATYFPTIQSIGYQASSFSTPFPPGGGVGASPIYGGTTMFQAGNVYVNPLNFSWKIGSAPLFINAGLGFVAPTGTTYAGALMPDFWTIRPHAAITYLGDDLNLTANFTYDINTASAGNTGAYQIIARAPTTPAFLSSLLTGPANPGRGFTSGDLLYVDLTATKRFGKWEVGPVGYIQYQTTNDSPGGVNPANGAAWTCSQLTSAGLPSCGKSLNIGAGLLVGYNFGPVDMKLIYMNGFYTKDAIDAPTGSRIVLKTSFRLWAPDEASSPKKALYTKN
jgi:hypothetical protein